MISSQDIQNVTFEKAMRGYRTDEVDEYLAKIATELDAMATAKAEMEKKLYILAEKVDQYRQDEETLKTALLNAQRLGETVVYEAKQKAETIVYEATSKASQATEEAASRVAQEEMALVKLQAEVTRFKNDVLNLYKQHIECLSAIPEVESDKLAARRASAQNRIKNEQLKKDEAVAASALGETSYKEEAAVSASAPMQMQAPEAQSEKAPAPMFDNYQGIRFDD